MAFKDICDVCFWMKVAVVLEGFTMYILCCTSGGSTSLSQSSSFLGARLVLIWNTHAQTERYVTFLSIVFTVLYVIKFIDFIS